MGPWTKKGIYETGRVLFLPVESIVPNPNQPRKQFVQEDLEELARSIRSLGILQPLTVRRREGNWELIAGERRLRAAKLAGLGQVPCLAVHTDSQSSSLLALVENIQRRNLDFLEEALAIRRLIDTYHLSQEETARRLGKSQSAIANKLRLLKLPEDVLSALREGGCSERHARALLRLPHPDLQRAATARILKHTLTVSQTEILVDELLTRNESTAKRSPTFIVKDIRLFLNTITHSLDVMRSAGVDARCRREDTEEAILLTIHIPRKATS